MNTRQTLLLCGIVAGITAAAIGLTGLAFDLRHARAQAAALEAGPASLIERRAYVCGWLAGGFGDSESGGPKDLCNRYRGMNSR